MADFLINYSDRTKVLEEIKGYDLLAKQKKKVMKIYCKENNIKFRWIEQNEMKGYKQWLKCSVSAAPVSSAVI